MKKITNGQNVENFEKREKLRWAIIITLVITITFAIASLFVNINFKNEILANTFTCISFIFFFITYILKRMRDKIKIETSTKLKKGTKK